jgi:hypothetical protein
MGPQIAHGPQPLPFHRFERPNMDDFVAFFRRLFDTEGFIPRDT